MSLTEIIRQARKLALTDKNIAYHYLLGMMLRANGYDPDYPDHKVDTNK